MENKNDVELLMEEWLQWRKKMGFKKWKPATVERNLKKFSNFTPDQVRIVLDYSMDNQYQGLFWNILDKYNGKSTTSIDDELRSF